MKSGDVFLQRLPLLFSVVIVAALGVESAFVVGVLSKAAQAAARGQGESLFAVLREKMRGTTPRDIHQRLPTILDQMRPDGVYSLQLLTPDGLVVESFGSPRLNAGRLFELENGRARLVEQLPPPPDAETPNDRAEAFQPPSLACEFESPLAKTLQRQAFMLALINGLIAVVTLVSGAVFARQAALKARLQSEVERSRRLSAVGQMSAVLAHEIKNPLASLKGHAQLLQEALHHDERSAKKADRLVTDIQRLERLTNGLLEFVREGPLQPESISVNALLRRALGTFENKAFTVQFLATDRTAWVDVARLERVIVNLVQNALEATPAKGPVAIELTAVAGAFECSIKDQGPGISATAQNTLFEPFFTEKASGTGLGLSVAKRVVELHGGTLKGSNRETGGAVFRVQLPLGSEPTAPEGARSWP